MEIGYFVSKFPYTQKYKNYLYGGSIEAAYNIAKIMMNKKNHNISIFTTSKDFKDVINNYHNIHIYRYGNLLKIASSNVSLRYMYKPLQYNMDIAHVHFDIPPGPLSGLIYSKIKKVPMILSYHGDWIDNSDNIRNNFMINMNNRLYVKKLLNSAKVIISPSKNYIKYSKYLPKYKEKIIVVPNGLQLDDYEINKSKIECRNLLKIQQYDKIILFLGNLIYHKGPDILLKAYKKILEKLPNSLLIISGDGPMKNNLITLVKELKIDNNVRFTGYIDKLKVYYLYASDIICVPSRIDCFPTVILEAMACGLPVIGTNVGGIPDAIIDNTNGFLFQLNNINEISEKILYLFENEDIIKRFGENSKKLVKNYSWVEICEQIDKLYSETI